MFTFNILLFIFNLFLLFAERGRRNMEESIHNKNHWPQLLHVSGVECPIDRFACFAAYFSSFPRENAFQNCWRSLMNYRPENRIPWPFTDFDNTKDFPRLFKKFPDFSLTLKIFVFPRLFPDRSNHDITKNNSLRKINVIRSQYSKYIDHVCCCSNTTLTKEMLFGKSTCRHPYKQNPWINIAIKSLNVCIKQAKRSKEVAQTFRLCSRQCISMLKGLLSGGF